MCTTPLCTLPGPSAPSTRLAGNAKNHALRSSGRYGRFTRSRCQQTFHALHMQSANHISGSTNKENKPSIRASMCNVTGMMLTESGVWPGVPLCKPCSLCFATHGDHDPLFVLQQHHQIRIVASLRSPAAVECRRYGHDRLLGVDVYVAQGQLDPLHSELHICSSCTTICAIKDCTTTVCMSSLFARRSRPGLTPVMYLFSTHVLM